MGINIVNQTNEQECGVCALVALHNHFYKDVVEKEQALEHGHISESGMTIFDFEALGIDLGLECESYEIKFSEFVGLKINNYFVLLVSTGASQSNHYIIGRKKKKYIEIYDSCSLEMNKMKYSDLKSIFLNVIILVKKKPNKSFRKLFGNVTTLLMFDLKFVLLNVGLSVLILATSMAVASFLNFIIDLAIGRSSVNNLVTVCFIFILFYFVNDILSYVSSLYTTKHVKNYFILFTNKILGCLQNKKPNFLSKVDKNWIFKVDECVYNISNFCIVEINKFITNIIFLIACICVIGSMQYYLLIFVLIYAIIELIFFLFSYKKKKEVFLNIVRSENGNAHHYKNLINSLNNEIWSAKRMTLIDKIKTNYSSIYKNYSDVILFKSNSSLFKSLLKSLCEIFLIAILSFFVIQDNTLSIGRLTFVISAFGLYKNSTNELFNYFLTKLEFNVYWQVYKDLTTVSNIDPNQDFKLKQTVKTISFKLDDQLIKLDVKKQINEIKLPIINLIKESNKIYINGKVTKLSQEFFNSIIVCDQQSNPDTKYLIQKIELDPIKYAQYLEFFQIDLNKEIQPFYDGIIINLLSLIHEKDKIVFIDNILEFVRKKDKVVVKQLLSLIKKNNTVFIVGKEEND